MHVGLNFSLVHVLRDEFILASVKIRFTPDWLRVFPITDIIVLSHYGIYDENKSTVQTKMAAQADEAKRIFIKDNARVPTKAWFEFIDGFYLISFLYIRRTSFLHKCTFEVSFCCFTYFH